jgi:hypothetical protein
MAKKRVVKKAAPKKRSGGKPAAKGSARKAAGSKKKSARRSAGGTLENVRLAGERTWNALRSTTAQVVEGVKDRLGPEDGGSRR